MNRVLAGALILAISGAVFQTVLPGAIRSAPPGEYAAAVSSALVPGIIVVALGAIITWLLVRAPRDPVTPPESELIHHQHHRRFHLW